jgi:hypothetical protein
MERDYIITWILWPVGQWEELLTQETIPNLIWKAFPTCLKSRNSLHILGQKWLNQYFFIVWGCSLVVVCRHVVLGSISSTTKTPVILGTL